MKSRKFLLLILASIFAAVAISACGEKEPKPEPEPEPGVETISLEVNNVEIKEVSVSFKVKAQNVKELACYISDRDENDVVIRPNVVFAMAEESVYSLSKNCDTTFVFENLKPSSTYYFYFAGKIADKQYVTEVGEKGVISFELTTKDYEEGVTIAKVGPFGFQAYVKPPQAVLDRKGGLRYSVADLYTYNMHYYEMPSHPTDVTSLLHNGKAAYEGCAITTPTLLVYDDTNTDVDEEGNPSATPIVPGEPSVLYLGEFTYDKAEAERIGWGDGNAPYVKAAFDFESAAGVSVEPQGIAPERPDDKYWTGFHYREVIMSNAPGTFDGKLNLEVSYINNVPQISIKPSDNVFTYCVGIVPDMPSTQGYDYYNTIVKYLGGDASLLQWFTTSYAGWVESFSNNFYGPAQIKAAAESGEFTEEQIAQLGDGSVTFDLEQYLGALLPENYKYRIIVVGLDSQRGLNQIVEKAVLEPRPVSKPAPVVEVKGIPNPSGKENPFEIWFNIKAPNKDLVKGLWLCNYEREWEEITTKDFTNYNLIRKYGLQFSDEELAVVNSDNGYDVSFATREDAVTYLGVLGFNDEGSTNDINSGVGLGKARSIKYPAAEKVESDLFTALNGEWTATTKLRRVKEHDEEGNIVSTEEVEYSTKVVISNGYTVPAEPTKEVFSAYEKTMSSNEIKALYANFVETVDNFNSKIAGQNMLLCEGFSFTFDEDELEDFRTYSPYELFIHPTYVAYDNESIVYDCGPKWFLQIHKDGSVTAPFSSSYFYPATGFYYPYWMGGLEKDNYTLVQEETNSDQTVSPAHFPVEVSEDRNTITIKALSRTFKMEDGSEVVYNFYPYLYVYDQSSMQVNGMKNPIVSDIVLTRASAASPASAVVRSSETSAVGRLQRQEGAGRAVKNHARSNNKPYTHGQKLSDKMTEFWLK